MKRNVRFYLVIGLWGVLLLSGCQSMFQHSNISEQPPYRDMIGKHYTMLKGFYLCRSGNIICLRAAGIVGFPQKISKENIGKVINDKKIVGIMAEGSTFTLSRVTKCELESETFIIPFIRLSPTLNDVEASILWEEQFWNFSLVKGYFPEDYYKNGIVGKWEFKQQRSTSKSHVLEEFAADGAWSWDGTFIRNKATTRIKLKGIWTLKQNKVFITITQSSVPERLREGQQEEQTIVYLTHDKLKISDFDGDVEYVLTRVTEK